VQWAMDPLPSRRRGVDPVEVEAEAEREAEACSTAVAARPARNPRQWLHSVATGTLRQRTGRARQLR